MFVCVCVCKCGHAHVCRGQSWELVLFLYCGSCRSNSSHHSNMANVYLLSHSPVLKFVLCFICILCMYVCQYLLNECGNQTCVSCSPLLHLPFSFWSSLPHSKRYAVRMYVAIHRRQSSQKCRKCNPVAFQALTFKLVL